MAITTRNLLLLLSTTFLSLFSAVVHADFTADWTSYSERADMPMSENWRSEMRSKLQKVDVNSLSAEQKERYKEMMFQLRDDVHSSSSGYGDGDSSPISPQTFGLILAGVAFFAYHRWQAGRQGGAGMVLGAAEGGAGGGIAPAAGGVGGGGGSWGSSASVGQTDAQRQAMREARLRQFERPTSEPMPNPWG